jgi:osmotically-inducible protein OsmY
MSLLALPSANREKPTTGHNPTIEQKVAERLRLSSYGALRDIRLSTNDGVVCLMGCLPSHYLKQVAQEIAAGVEGVQHVVNRIRVYPTYSNRAETLANEAI